MTAEEPDGRVPGRDEEPDENPQAEDLLADWGRRAGRFLAAATARAREGAEDLLAEAQSIRRGERD